MTRNPAEGHGERVTRPSRVERAAALLLMLAFLAAMLGGALFVWEESDHSATAMIAYGDLVLKIGVLVGLLFIAFGGVLWLIRRSRSAPGNR